MSTSRSVSWQQMLEKNAPEVWKQVAGLQQTAMAEGALSVKTKTLMMMLCDALLGHSEGVTNLARRARSLGATEAEINETLAVAFLMGGMPGLVTCANAYRE